jgi:proline iminopeptidase
MRGWAGFRVYRGQDMTANEGYIMIEDGVRLFFETAGKGEETLMILNGIFMFSDFKYLADGRRLIAIDLRNRGRSDYVSDGSKLRGVQQDVEDIDVVRRHFELDRMDLIAHSYAGVIPVLYAMNYPAHVRRVVQLSPVQPDQSTRYPAHLMSADAVLQQFFANVRELEQERELLGPQKFCRKFWALLRPLYVANPDDAVKIKGWEHCHLSTELNLMKYWMEVLMPSLLRLHFTSEDFAKVQCPVLTIHGTKDRSAPYGGGREWALVLPDARLLTIENVAHAPWIEAPEKVYGPVKTFLEGAWPEGTEKVQSL